MNREKLLAQLTALDFMAVDLALYLNLHPCDTETIEKYNCIIKEADMIRCEYEKNFGPLCSYRSSSPDERWAWIENPWPWECSFNYNMIGKD